MKCYCVLHSYVDPAICNSCVCVCSVKVCMFRQSSITCTQSYHTVAHPIKVCPANVIVWHLPTCGLCLSHLSRTEINGPTVNWLRRWRCSVPATTSGFAVVGLRGWGGFRLIRGTGIFLMVFGTLNSTALRKWNCGLHLRVISIEPNMALVA